MKEILKYLEEFAEQRIDDIGVDAELNNQDYISIREKATDIEKEILKAEDIQKAFLEYEDLNSKREAVIRRVMYKKGFLDCLKITKLLHQYSS